MRPASAATMPAIRWRRVVFPEPEVPMRATCSASARVRESMSMTGRVLPSGAVYCFLSWWRWRDTFAESSSR
jgi:hypothetical protein